MMLKLCSEVVCSLEDHHRRLRWCWANLVSVDGFFRWGSKDPRQVQRMHELHNRSRELEERTLHVLKQHIESLRKEGSPI